MARAAKVIFEQPLMVLRVIETVKGDFDIEVAMLEGPSVGVTEPNEFVAKTINAGLLKGYISELIKVQERMKDALTSVADKAQKEKAAKEGGLSPTLPSKDTQDERLHTEDSENGDT